MGRSAKTLARVLRGVSDANIRFDEEFLHDFYGKILVIGDEDNLVLLDESRAPRLIPWFTIRFVEVD